MIDRKYVAEVMHSAVKGGVPVLEALEAEGYAVVRAGMVPSLDPITDVEQRLDQLGNHVGNVQHDHAGARSAATLLRQLRELACIVLDIDPADVDDEDPADDR